MTPTNLTISIPVSRHPEAARLRRNALCHAYFQDRRADLLTPEGRRRAILELTESKRLIDDPPTSARASGTISSVV